MHSGFTLQYSLEACPLTKSDLSAMDFVVHRFFMKLFRTNNIETVKSCQYYFNFQPPSLLWSKRVKKFDNKYDLFTGSLFTV